MNPTTPREVGHRRRPGKVHTGRVVALGTALAMTAGIAIGSLVATERDATAATSQVGAAVAAAVVPSVSVVTEAPASEPTTEPTAASKAKKPKKTVPPLPANSGDGRRIVFDQTDQRVWLVEKNGRTHRSYLVSGSRFDNLKPGTYSITSRQRHAVAFDSSGTMEYFMRFATGYSEPIGFHAIPVYNNGEPEQAVKELGTALSAGCVRQKTSDAKYLWDWAPDGTTVVVTA